MLTRRALLLTAGLAACGRRRAPRYAGWLFIASAGERGIAVADLADFKRVTTIPLPRVPAQILPAGARVFATSPDAHALYEIDPQQFTVPATIAVPADIVTSMVAPGGEFVLVATNRPAAVRAIDVKSRRVTRVTPLPDSPVAMDASRNMAAVVTGSGDLVRISLSDGKVLGSTPLGVRAGIVRFRPDGKALLAGASEQNEIVVLDAFNGALMARLPLAFAPRRFCFSADNGGQMFVTGASDDSVIIVSPYQSEVDQTMVAGRQPYGLAVASTGGRNLLCVTNTGSADLTIFDIDTRGLASSVHIGGSPGEVLITPSGGWALVIDRESGDVSVVWLNAALNRTQVAAVGQGTRPLFTVFPTATRPRSAAIVPHPS